MQSLLCRLIGSRQLLTSTAASHCSQKGLVPLAGSFQRPGTDSASMAAALDVGALLSSGPADMGLTPLLAGLWGDHTAALPHWFAQESQLRAHYSECAIDWWSTCVRILYSARCFALASSWQ